MKFKTRGPITDHDEIPYLVRQADHELETLVKQIDYVALIGPRLSGKTSMMMRLLNRLRALPRYVMPYVNLILYRGYDPDRWFEALYNEMVFSAGGALPRPTTSVRDAIDFREAIVDVLEGELNNRVLILLLDEVETVPETIRTSFFATLREMFVSRGVKPALRQMTVVLGGSYIPDELIADPTISPFRVAEKVYIEDTSDLSPLLQALDREDRPMSSDVPARIAEWTEGDIYLTQRLCTWLDRRYPSGRIQPAEVDQIVERYLNDDDIFNGLEAKLQAVPDALAVVTSIVTKQTGIRFTRTNRGVSHAWLLGCIKPNYYGNCTTRNAIYENFLREMMKRIPSEPVPAAPPPPPKPPLEHKLLNGRYLLESVIRRSIMSHIYRARDLKESQTVVIKQLLSGRGGDLLAWRRFQREAESLRRLSHTNIVKLYETFFSGEYNYIVMEYVDGGTVEQLLNREGRQPIPLTLNIMIGIADALRYTHSEGIVHRDLKPSNILLTRNFSPRLADFGVARFLNQMERITATYAVVGTPAYIAPESYENEEQISPTEDIWSIGVTLYEMLTGTLPFTGRTQDHMRHAVQNDPIPRVQDVRPDVPDILADLLNRTMTRDVTLRLPDGTALYEALIQARAALA